MSSYLGKNLHVSIFGQSHASAIGVAVDGLPAGEPINLDALEAFLSAGPPGETPPLPPARRRTSPASCAVWWMASPAAPL